jgi:translation initiation factor 1
MGNKKHEGIVYSTNPDFNDQRKDNLEESPTLANGQQLLYIWLEAKGRKGKTVTLIKGFKGVVNDLEILGGEIKRFCGTGGTVKDMEIIIQGDFREKIIRFLSEKGYRTKKAGG